MKKLLLIAFTLLITSSSAFAGEGYGRGGGGGHGGGGFWIIPALIGGAIIYDLTRPQPIYQQPTPVYVQQPPVYQQYSPPNNNAGIATLSTPNWYYCTSSAGYYPYVKACPEGWKVVSSIPPPATSNAPPPPPQ